MAVRLIIFCLSAPAIACHAVVRQPPDEGGSVFDPPFSPGFAPHRAVALGDGGSELNKRMELVCAFVSYTPRNALPMLAKALPCRAVASAKADPPQ